MKTSPFGHGPWSQLWIRPAESVPNEQEWISEIDAAMIRMGMGIVVQMFPPHDLSYRRDPDDKTYELRIYGDLDEYNEMVRTLLSFSPKGEVIRFRHYEN